MLFNTIFIGGYTYYELELRHQIYFCFSHKVDEQMRCMNGQMSECGQKLCRRNKRIDKGAIKLFMHDMKKRLNSS